MPSVSNVRRIQTEDDSLAFQWGETGIQYRFDAGNFEAGLLAFKKAVAEGLALGEIGNMSQLERDVAHYLTQVAQDVAVKEASAEETVIPASGDPAEVAETNDLELSYFITKSSDEERYTLGPLYAPDRKDAHGEWTDPTTLQKAVWDYVRQSADEGRRLNLQHETTGEETVAEWVEVMAWPYEHTIKVADPGTGAEVELTMPAGTVYMGAIWDAEVWPLVKSGKLAGYSLGGYAMRVDEGSADMPDMGYKLAAAAAPAKKAGAEIVWDYEDGDRATADRMIWALASALNPEPTCTCTCYCDYDYCECVCCCTPARWCVSDVNEGRALVWDTTSEEWDAYIVPFTVAGEEIVPAPEDEWTSTAEAWVAVARSRTQAKLAARQAAATAKAAKAAEKASETT
jgi:hypothetical protein